MDRATATWAMALPRRRAMRAYRSPRKVAVPAAPRRPARRRRGRSCCPSSACPCRAGCRTGWRTGTARPGDQVRRRGEHRHIQADLGDDHDGQPHADAGDLGQPVRGGQHRGVRAGAAAGPGPPGRVDPPGFGHLGQRRDGLVLHLLDPLVQERHLVQQHLRDHPVVGIEHAVQRLGELVPLAAQRPLGQVRQRARVAFPGGQRGHHRHHRLGLQPVPGHRGDLDHGVFQQLLKPLQDPGPLPDQVRSGPG